MDWDRWQPVGAGVTGLKHGMGSVWSRCVETVCLGYGLVWFHKGTRLARLYSVALLPEMRGIGTAVRLMRELELVTAERGYLFMRLEVAKSNESAAALYRRCGYRVFGE